MPAKKSSDTGGTDTPPVKSNPFEDRHIKYRDERRVLEAELSTIDNEIRQAINDGNLEALDKLSARKAELPRLYIAASTGEMAARQAISGAEDKDNLDHLRAAEDLRDDLQRDLAALKAKHAEEVEALTSKLNAAITDVGATYAAIQAARDLTASCDAGFKRAMARITGV